MQAIQTKFILATNTRPTRIKAWCGAGSLTMTYPSGHDSPQSAHRVVARALVKKLGWDEINGSDALKGGCLPNGDYCFVLDNVWAND